MSALRPIAVTCGDPAGIGPDLLLTLPEQFPQAPLVLLADHQQLMTRAKQLDISPTLPLWQPEDGTPTQPVVWHQPLVVPAIAGQPDARNGGTILQWLNLATDGCMAQQFSAMVTAPLAKHVIADQACPGFTGHTEYLAARAGVDKVVMMLACPGLRVALATTHLPLRDVADQIQTDSLEQTLRILIADLQQKYAIRQPRILVLGLNPHAGEAGLLGHEEDQIISPLLDKLRQEGLQLTGPVPADTAFQPAYLEQHDAVFAMYHDQGLPVLKYAGFGRSINITLGLPFIRTSVDHGTAFPLAGSGQAKSGSLFAAVEEALALGLRRGQDGDHEST